MEEYLDLMEEIAALPTIEPPYTNTRRVPGGFGKKRAPFCDLKEGA
jgi:hypothetical protein